MPQYKLLVATFPYHRQQDPDVANWVCDHASKWAADPRISHVFHRYYDDTPITMTRNRAIADALESGSDYLLMIDSDMAPDLLVGQDPLAKPFWETSFEHLLTQPVPGVVAAPYCGPPPIENVYVFRWANSRNANPNTGEEGQITAYSREEASQLAGIQEAAALPTGLILFDVRIFKKLPFPWTYYEYKGDGKKCDGCNQFRPGRQIEKASTEDVTLTRDISLAGFKVWCNWDSWAGHWKRLCVGKPRPSTVDKIRGNLILAIEAGLRSDEQVVMARPEGIPA